MWNDDLFVTSVILARFVVVGLGAAYTGMLLKIVIPVWSTLDKAGKWTAAMLLAYCLNVTLFTALVLAETAPRHPQSFMQFGFLVVFLLGIRSLSLYRKRN